MSFHLQNEIDSLKQQLLRMAGLAQTAVNRATQALATRDPELAQRVKEDDDALDRLEMEVDEMAIQLLAKAPLASDLRLITASMKISRDLERIGDEATTIARRAYDLSLEPRWQLQANFPDCCGLPLICSRKPLTPLSIRTRPVPGAFLPGTERTGCTNRFRPE